MKNYIKFSAVALVAFFMASIPAFAKEVSIDTIGSVIDEFNDHTDSVYVIGENVYTNDHTLKTQDIMYAAMSIDVGDVENLEGEYDQMTIFLLKRERNNQNGEPTGKWIVKDNHVGTSDFPEKLNIKYVDYKEVREKYNVTFEYDNGTDNEVVQVYENDKVAEPEEPTKTGYSFEGWYLDDSQDAFDFTNTPITGNITLKAKWQANTYTATFTGDNISEDPQSGEYPFTPTAPSTQTRDGYDFDGWYIGDEKYEFDEPLTSNVEIEGRWKIKTFEVNFYDNDDDNELIEGKTVDWNTVVTGPTEPTRRGYDFKGWTKGKDGEDYSLETPVKENLELYAKWEAKKYTVTFKCEGCLTTPEAQSLTYPAQPTKPETDPKKEGNGFAGWYVVGENEVFDFDNADIYEDVTIEARFTPGVYSLKFTCEDCTGLPDDIHVTYPETPSKPSKVPVKVGYTFKYWYLTDDSTEYQFNETISEDTTLKAKFDINKYEVKFDVNTEEEVENKPTNQSIEYKGHAAEPKPEPTRTGYDFLGWYVKRGPVTEENQFDFKNREITGPVTLVAKWQLKTYTVTFKLDETVLGTINGVKHGTTVQKAIADAQQDLSPYKEGYRFSHWYLDPGPDSSEYELTNQVTDNITLKAKMIPLVDIDNLVSNMALEVETESFVVSAANKVITIDVSTGDDDYSTAHNDDKISDLVDTGNTGIAKAIKEVVANENVQNVKMSYDSQDYEFTNDEDAIKQQLKALLGAIAVKNSSSYETATLNELIKNDYNANPLTLTITLKDTADTVDGQDSPATYKVKVASSIITVTNESEFKNAISGNYDAIKIGDSFSVTDPIMINRSVSIFGKDIDTTITLDKPEANTVLDIRYSGVGGTKTDVNIKDLTLKGAKKGISVPEASTSLSIMNVKFTNNSDMAMEINGKIHANGTLSYDKEDYNHPFIRTKRSNAITGGLSTNAKITGNIEIHEGYAAYDYKTIQPFGGQKYEDEDFKEHTWKTNGWEIGDDWCEGCKDDNGDLKQEYQELIGQPDTTASDSVAGTNWAHYYLQKEHAQYYTIVFKDTPSAALTWRYVLYGADPVEPGEPLPWFAFKSFAKKRTIGKDLDQKNYELKGWSDDSKGKSQDHEFDITNVQESRYYYTHYEEIVGPMAASIQAMNWANNIIQK